MNEKKKTYVFKLRMNQNDMEMLTGLSVLQNKSKSEILRIALKTYFHITVK